MKPIFAILFAAALAAPLSAQDPGPGNDLIDLFEKSQREGATDEELMRMLENKALIDPQEFRELTPEELQHEKDAVFDVLRRLNKGNVEPEKTGQPKDQTKPRPMRDGPSSGTISQTPRWFVGLVVAPLDPALRSHFDLPKDAGVLVESVMRGSPAAEAGIRQNDIVVTANGRNVSSLEALKAEVAKAGSEGKAMNLEVIQRGKRTVVKVTPRGPEAPAAKSDRADQGPAMRPMIEIQRRLDAQQKEIEALRREIRQLRARLDQE
jgi:membrane-associated protease RseP (regulator of RpoE activity)